jgi:hypothetical protein
MKIAAIKELVEKHDIATLQQAEELLCNGEALPIEVKGDDEGEQLTHILAAAEILAAMQNEGKDLRTALREFSERVRKSIT